MEKIKAVIFDMDGVLIDSEPANLKQLYGFYKEYGFEADDAFLISLVGSSLEYTWRVSIEKMKKDWSQETFYKYFDTYAEAHVVSYHDILNPGVKETLIWLREHGYHTAIGSSSVLVNIQRMIKECELEGLFDIVFSGEMFHESKPNPEIYLTIAKQLGIKPEHCMVIEDSTFGIEAGKRAGMRTIALHDTKFSIDQSEADEMIEQIADIQTLLA